MLGLGAGWNEPEFAAYGFPWERRFDRFEDGLRIVTSMLRTGRADHEGASSPRGARSSGRAGRDPRACRSWSAPPDRGCSGSPRSSPTSGTPGCAHPAELVPMLETLDAALQAVGRDPASIRRSAEAMVRPGGAAGHRERPPTRWATGSTR